MRMGIDEFFIVLKWILFNPISTYVWFGFVGSLLFYANQFVCRRLSFQSMKIDALFHVVAF
jgi:hypothetical protein